MPSAANSGSQQQTAHSVGTLALYALILFDCKQT